MSKITDLFDYFLNCPQLHDLLAISGEASKGKEIFFPRGSSPIYATQNENIDVLGNYNGTFLPFPSLYEDWQMNLYRHADPNDDPVFRQERATRDDRGGGTNKRRK